MRCSGCGKDIPMLGQVCPYCHKDKTKDAEAHGLAIAFGLIGVFLGYQLSGFGSAVIVGIIGVFVGLGVGKRMDNSLGLPKNEVAKTDAQDLNHKKIEIVQQHTAGGNDVENRLIKLSELHKKGLIDDNDYHEKKKALLKDL